MNISIFGYKLNLEILILIGVIYLIMVGHTVCGCCNYDKVKEGFNKLVANTVHNNGNFDMSGNHHALLMTQKGNGNVQPSGNVVNKKAKKQMVNGKEGFVGANTNNGLSSPYNINEPQTIDTQSWNKPDMNVVPGKPLSEGVKQFLEREPQPVPLPEGEMLMFANTPFKPECCPNTYSNSSGCACMTGEQYNWLQMRGSNNVPYSQY